mgnify:CR=1
MGSLIWTLPVKIVFSPVKVPENEPFSSFIYGRSVEPAFILLISCIAASKFYLSVALIAPD